MKYDSFINLALRYIVPCICCVLVYGNAYCLKTYSDMRWLVDGIYYTTSPDIQYESEVTEVYVCSTVTDLNASYYLPASQYSGDIIIPSYIEISGRKVPVTRIEDGAFKESDINSVKIPDTVREIGYESFLGTRISSIDFPSSLKVIESSAFKDTKNLKSVIVPATVDYVGSHVFKYSGLEKAEYLSTYSKCNGLFEYCGSLSSVKLSQEMTSIPSMMFWECHSLLNIVIHDKVESIGQYAFAGMGYPEWVESITIGKSVKNIDRGAFSGVKLKKMICLAEVPPKLVLDDGASNPHYKPAFEEATTENCVLYVPLGSVDAYKMDEGWRIRHIEPIEESGITELPDYGENYTIVGNTISIDIDADIMVNIYSIDGILRFKSNGPSEVELPSGLYILQLGGRTHRIRI